MAVHSRQLQAMVGCRQHARLEATGAPQAPRGRGLSNWRNR